MYPRLSFVVVFIFQASTSVMAGHSRPKDGVASLAYDPAIHVFKRNRKSKTWMPATSAGMTKKWQKARDCSRAFLIFVAE
jgi:hypothetical protein